MKGDLDMKVTMLIIWGVFFVCSQAVLGLTDSELITIRDGFETRRASVLNSQIGSPYPGTNYPADGDLGIYVWNRQDFALSALYQNTQLPEANQAVIDACQALIDASAFGGEFGFHWQGNLFYRIYKFFYHGSEYFPGRLTPQAESMICEVMWLWGKGQSKMTHADYSQHQTWVYWGSENHDAQHKTTNYSAVDILKDVPEYQSRAFDDGFTAAQHYAAWTAYFKEYLSQRARRGLLVELGSYTYTKYTLQGWYNFYDFAPDLELRRLAGNLLDLWWTDWSLDQINAVRGGGKSRVYQNVTTVSTNDAAYAMVWYYLNVGIVRNRHPGVMCLVTSGYRLPLVVMDIALDTAGKGVYEFKSRRPGLLSTPADADGVIGIDSLTPGILRYTYHTPAYVLGTCMVAKRSNSEWTPISNQNRWLGAIFATHPDARIFPECVGTGNGNTWNQHWSVQNKGTLIVQKLSTSTNSGAMRVFFSGGATNMTITEENGWVFARMSNAFAAVRPAWGTYSWDDANWIRFSDHYAPVIMEVWQSSDFSNVFSLFKAAVFAQTINVNSGVLTYTGLKDAGEFTFYTNSSTLPRINGVPISFATEYTFQSPFLNSDWDSKQIVISKDDRTLNLNFNYDELPSCDELTADLNGDCEVDEDDLKILAANWLTDISLTNPSVPFIDTESVLGLWHFETITIDGENSIFLDDNSANPGRVNNLRIWEGGVPYVSVADEGRFGNAVKFSASATDVYLLLADDWNPDWKTFAFRGWIRFDSGDTGGYLAHVYDRLYLHCTLNTLTFYVTDGAAGVTITAPLADPAQWQYVEAVYDGQTISLKTQLQTVTDGGIGDISLAEQKSLYVGSRKNRNRFTGMMDEVRISTADQTNPGFFAPLTADINGDGIVNSFDFAIMAEQWYGD